MMVVISVILWEADLMRLYQALKYTPLVPLASFRCPYRYGPRQYRVWHSVRLKLFDQADATIGHQPAQPSHKSPRNMKVVPTSERSGDRPMWRITGLGNLRPTGFRPAMRAAKRCSK